MCTAFVIRNSNKIIFAMNRDADFSKESASMDYDGELGLYYGQDLVNGGSWFTTNSFGDFSFVTTIRDKSTFDKNKKSCGNLPFKALAGDSFCLEEYNSCNLITFKQGKLFYQNSITKPIEIEDNYFGISNETYPCQWEKVRQGIDAFKKLDLNKNKFELILDIRKIMLNDKQYDLLPSDTGFSKAEEKDLSSIYIDTENYGTVSTTILIIGEYNVHLNEKNYANQSEFNRIL